MCGADVHFTAASLTRRYQPLYWREFLLMRTQTRITRLVIEMALTVDTLLSLTVSEELEG